MARSRPTQTTDRRRGKRIPIAIPIFVRGVDQRGEKFLEFTNALNISAEGALLVMRRYLPPKSEVSLEIPAAPMPLSKIRPQSVRRLRAQVVQVKHLGRADLLGVRFTNSLLSASE